MTTTWKVVKYWMAAQFLLGPLDAFSGIDKPWMDQNDGGGDLTFLGYLFAAGIVFPLLSKIFEAGPWKNNSWIEVGVSGFFIALTLVLAIQVAIVAVVIVPIYLLFKFFGK